MQMQLRSQSEVVYFCITYECCVYNIMFYVACMHVIRIYVCMRYVHVCMYVCTYVCMYVCMYVCIPSSIRCRGYYFVAVCFSAATNRGRLLFKGGICLKSWQIAFTAEYYMWCDIARPERCW